MVALLVNDWVIDIHFLSVKNDHFSLFLFFTSSKLLKAE